MEFPSVLFLHFQFRLHAMALMFALCDHTCFQFVIVYTSTHTLRCWIETTWLLFGTCLLFGSSHFHKYEPCVLFGSIVFHNEAWVLFGLCWGLHEPCVDKIPNGMQGSELQTRAMCSLWIVLFSQTRVVCTIWNTCSIQHWRVIRQGTIGNCFRKHTPVFLITALDDY